MLKNEFYKLYKSKLLFVVAIILFVAAFAFALMFNALKTDDTQFGYGITAYTNFEEITTRIEQNELSLDALGQQFENGQITESDYSQQKEALTTVNAIYNYLFDNQIEYHDAQTIRFLGVFSNNQVAFVKNIAQILQMFLLLCFAVIVIFCLNYDFGRGTAKFVYANRHSRKRILWGKIFTIFITYLALCLFNALLIWVLSLSYKNNFTVLIDYQNGMATSMIPAVYIAKILFSVFIDTFCWLIAFISISLFVKNSFVAMGTYAALYVLFQMIFMGIPNSFFNALSVPYINIAINNVSITTYTIATLLKYFVFIIIFIISTFKFYKKDLI